MSLAATVEPGVLRRYASDQIVTLAKLVVENAFQPIVEAGTGTVFGYESLMRGQERIGFDTPIEILDEAHRDRPAAAARTDGRQPRARQIRDAAEFLHLDAVSSISMSG